MLKRPKPVQLRAITGGRANAEAELSDAELFEAVARGDKRVASELYHRLGPAVEHALIRIFGRREVDHDDLVQSSFEQIVLTLARRRYAQACSLKTWASTIAANVALKAMRSRQRERRVFTADGGPLTELVSAATDVEHEASVHRELDRLRKHLAAIGSAKAQAVLLHDVLGHDLAEIATIANCSVSAAQSRLVRGRRELAARLEREQAPARRQR